MTFVVDASVVVKWVVEEAGTAASLALRRDNRLVAPDLVIAECANILWKKARRGELTGPQANVAARLLERSGLELIPMQSFMADATNLAIELSHPAYDCIYLAVAVARRWPFVTADDGFVRKLRQATRFGSQVMTLAEAVPGYPG